MTLSHRLLVILGRLAVLAVILVGAEIGVRLGVLSQLFFSSPTEIFQALLTQCLKRCLAWSQARCSASPWA
jgi:ABC-type nitrate/sulfonate/bicarbonate transport system permease component